MLESDVGANMATVIICYFILKVYLTSLLFFFFLVSQQELTFILMISIDLILRFLSPQELHIVPQNEHKEVHRDQGLF